MPASVFADPAGDAGDAASTCSYIHVPREKVERDCSAYVRTYDTHADIGAV